MYFCSYETHPYTREIIKIKKRKKIPLKPQSIKLLTENRTSRKSLSLTRLVVHLYCQLKTLEGFHFFSSYNIPNSSIAIYTYLSPYIRLRVPQSRLYRYAYIHKYLDWMDVNELLNVLESIIIIIIIILGFLVEKWVYGGGSVVWRMREREGMSHYVFLCLCLLGFRAIEEESVGGANQFKFRG